MTESTMTERELDALVAEKVFQVPFEPYAKILTSLPAKTILETPFYSTDIAAAWTVVERLAPDCGFHLHLDEGCCVEIAMKPSYVKLLDVTAPTAPRAISLAALKACSHYQNSLDS